MSAPRTNPCLCRKCGFDTIDGCFRMPQHQTENERRQLLKSLGCDDFSRDTMKDFVHDEKVRNSQRISKHHFSVAQLKKVQGGKVGLKNNAVADIPLSEMLKPLHPVGLLTRTQSAKRKSDSPPSSRSCRRRSTSTISPHPMPPFPQTPTSSESQPHPAASASEAQVQPPPAASATQPSMTAEEPSMTAAECEEVIAHLKSQLEKAQKLIEVMERHAEVT